MGVYIKNVTAKEMNDLFDEHAIWWIEPDDIIDIEEEPQTEIEIIACPIVDEFEMCERMYRDEPQTDCAWR